MTANIETQNLSRTYETYKKPEGVLKSVQGLWARKTEQKVALQPTTLRIEKGQIVGLVGSNGAGKTTLLKLLSGLIHPSEGSAKVLGYEPTSRDPDFLRRISILLGQKNQLWWDLPPADSYDLLARIYEIKLSVARDRVRELTNLLQCSDQLHTQLRRLSLGERMKMEIIGALLHQPEVLFLDEPTIGLDIIAQTTIREFLAKYVKERSPTVILTSHYMDDISLLADRLLLMSQGRIVYDGSVNDFTGRAEARQTLSLKILQPPENDVSIAGLFVLPAGSLALSQELPAHAIGEVLQALMTLSPVQEIKIEEVEFEDVIRSFMEQDARLRAPSRAPTARV
jgi:ABC-2 type transport system ATP-binding protein